MSSDCLNNQFLLYPLLDRLNSTILQYLENYNVNLKNYYCIVEKKCQNITVLVTSNTIKNKEIGRRIITIEETEYCENNIYTLDDTLHIQYESTRITIGELVGTKNFVSELYNIYIHTQKFVTMRENYWYCDCEYSSNIDETQIKLLVIVNSPRNKQCPKFNMFSNLKHINASSVEYFSQDSLPSSLKTLTIEKIINPLDIRCLPNNLRTLIYNACHPIEVNILPKNLDSLFLGKYFKSPLGINVLPENLQSLTLGELYVTPIKLNILPHNLKILRVGRYYITEFGTNVLPSSLQELEVSCYYPLNVLKSNLPNISVIKINCYGLDIKYIKPLKYTHIIEYL
jgi:hypothetical protein